MNSFLLLFLRHTHDLRRTQTLVGCLTSLKATRLFARKQHNHLHAPACLTHLLRFLQQPKRRVECLTSVWESVGLVELFNVIDKLLNEAWSGGLQRIGVGARHQFRGFWAEGDHSYKVSGIQRFQEALQRFGQHALFGEQAGSVQQENEILPTRHGGDEPRAVHR